MNTRSRCGTLFWRGQTRLTRSGREAAVLGHLDEKRKVFAVDGH